MQGHSLDPHSEPSALYVDLDGTLVHGDTSAEALARFVLTRPTGVFQVLRWLRHGRARVKHELAGRVPTDPFALPYNELFMVRLRDLQRATPRPELILASGAHERIVAQVAAHCEFDAVLASDAAVNRVGGAKLEAILERQQGRPFGYAGNAPIDLLVYAGAEDCWVVNPVGRVDSRLALTGKTYTLIDDRRPAPARWLACLGGGKPLLALLALWGGWLAGASGVVLLALLIGVACVASAACIARGFRDLDADRAHPVRRETGIANSEVHQGLLLGVGSVLGVLGVVLTFGAGIWSGWASVGLFAATIASGAHRRWPWWLTASVQPGLALAAGLLAG